jgi:putative tricarboxylic transport membrane protein
MRDQRSADLKAGLFLAGVGAVVVVAAAQIKAGVAERLPSATLPLTLGALLTLGGLLLAWRSWRLAEPGEAIAWPGAAGTKRVLLALLGLAAYVALIPWLGLPLASLLYTSGLIWYLDGRWLRALVVGLATGLVVQYVFIDLLELSFPVGPWLD